MPRSRQFNRDKALEAATRVFGAKGFAGTSADILTREMGIARQSLYDTFGSKRDLYLEALRAYSAGNVGALLAILQDTASPLAALREVLRAPALLPREERERGCFGVNAICEFGLSDAEVTGTAIASQARIDEAIASLIEEAKRKGEVPAHISTAAAGAFVGCMLAGLKVAGRAGAPSDVLAAAVDLAMSALTGPRST